MGAHRPLTSQNLRSEGHRSPLLYIKWGKVLAMKFPALRPPPGLLYFLFQT